MSESSELLVVQLSEKLSELLVVQLSERSDCLAEKLSELFE